MLSRRKEGRGGGGESSVFRAEAEGERVREKCVVVLLLLQKCWSTFSSLLPPLPSLEK